ncbi:MAG: ComEC family competence protein [Firmicutes bacterium]|nr:ComEC family competence protein [Bacillota bacterium]
MDDLLNKSNPIKPRLPAFAAVFLMLGIGATGMGGAVRVALLTAAGIGLVVMLMLFLRSARARAFAACVLLLFFTYGVFSALIATGTFKTPKPLNGALYGVVSDETSTGKYGDRAVLESITIDGKKVRGKVMLYVYGSVDLKAGDRVRLDDARAIPSVPDPKDSYSVGAYKRGIKYTVRANVSELDVSPGNPKFVSAARERIKSAVGAGLKNPARRGVAAALLLGDKSGVTEEDLAAYRGTGLLHLMAVSGLHIGFVLTLLGKLIPRKRRRAFLAVSAPLLLLYAAICRFSPSVMRAVIMALASQAAHVGGLRRDVPNSLALAAILILGISPLLLFDVSFILSFSCVLAIIRLSPSIERLCLRIKLPKRLASALAVDLAATVGSAPVIAAYFGEFALYSVFANLIAIPIAMVLFIVLFAATVLAVIIMPLAALIAVANPVFFVMEKLTRGISSLPGALVGARFPFALAPYCTAVYLCGSVSLLRPGRARKTAWTVIAGFISLMLLLISIV